MAPPSEDDFERLRTRGEQHNLFEDMLPKAAKEQQEES